MKNNPVASVEEIRSHFPALRRVHNGHHVAYFDGPGGTQVPTRVVDAVRDYLLNHNANTHWAYPTSGETDEILDNSRQALADFLNASPDEIVFGQNMTSLTFHLARSLGRKFKAGDEIIVTELDHHANVDTWRALESEQGVKTRTVQMDPESGMLDLGQLESYLNKKTKVVAIGAASNSLGTIVDVTRICTLAREAGAFSFVDAVHYAPHKLVDVKEFDCDFLACSAYKFYGPHVGVLYGRKNLLEKVDFPKVKPAPDYSPERAETGTQGHESIAGAAAAVDFLASLSDADTRREKLKQTFFGLTLRKDTLTRLLWEGLSSIENLRLYGPNYNLPRTPTVAFTIKGLNARTVAEQLAEQGIFASHGNFYALTVVERLDLSAVGGLVRLGCACYTTTEEIERVIEAVKSISK